MDSHGYWDDGAAQMVSPNDTPQSHFEVKAMKTVTTFLLALVFALILPTFSAAQRGGGGHSHGLGIGMNSGSMGSGHQMGGVQSRNSGNWGTMNRNQMGQSGHDPMVGNHDRDRRQQMDHNRQHSGQGRNGGHHGGTDHGQHGNDWWSQSW